MEPNHYLNLKPEDIGITNPEDCCYMNTPDHYWFVDLPDGIYHAIEDQDYTDLEVEVKSGRVIDIAPGEYYDATICRCQGCEPREPCKPDLKGPQLSMMSDLPFSMGANPTTADGVASEEANLTTELLNELEARIGLASTFMRNAKDDIQGIVKILKSCREDLDTIIVAVTGNPLRMVCGECAHYEHMLGLTAEEAESVPLYYLTDAIQWENSGRYCREPKCDNYCVYEEDCE